MDFGKLTDISGVDFCLPPDHPKTATVLGGKPTKLQVFSGCPIWSCNEWVGSIYPPNARSSDYLHYYSRRFNTIELNATHYRIPETATVKRWIEASPDTFRFCPKVLQTISHEHLLLHADLLTDAFCAAADNFGNRLGVCFLQLPPFFAPIHFKNLETFLRRFPTHIRLAVEFRSPQWFVQQNGITPFDHAADLLADLNIGTVICDTAGRRDAVHQCLTTPFALVRFIGNSLHPTDYSRVDDWVTRLKNWTAAGLKEFYFFAHEPDNILSPDLSDYFLKKANEAGLYALPKNNNYLPQGNLF